jgi:predicted Rossmann fold flavoprotein
MSHLSADIAIVGAGAAGLATAIFAGRARPELRILLLDGARKPGAKILVSGGSRCNVTNSVVTEADFNGGRRPVVRRILRAFPVDATVQFFAEIGVPLHEEPGGKLFPDTNRSRDVLDALLKATSKAGVTLLTEYRVIDVIRAGDGFTLLTSRGEIRARSVVLASGGLSLPKTGSDGTGYGFARALGHSIVQTTPALVPLVLTDGRDAGLQRNLSGVSHDATLEVWVDGARGTAVTGSLLWTHFGISGPAALDVSRHWLRARLLDPNVRLVVRLTPGRPFEDLDRIWTAAAASRGRSSLQRALATMVPAAVAAALLEALHLDGESALAELTRADRRRLVHALTAWTLPVRDSRGYNHAEVTAGGVALDEIDPGTMQSRICPGLFLVGEILDVDGRIGGFNFQWAWSSALVASRAIAHG